jgi:hypothetical protein
MTMTPTRTPVIANEYSLCAPPDPVVVNKYIICSGDQ